MRTICVLTNIIFVFLLLPARCHGKYTPYPSTLPKWTKPIQKRAPYVAHLAASSELTILLSKQMNHLPKSILRESPLAAALQMPATSVIVGLNVIVFAVWQLVALWPTSKLVTTMNHNFILSGWKRERLQRPHTFLTSGFSHIRKQHLVGNLAALLLFGKKTEQWLGPRTFVYLYITAIYVSDWMNLWVFKQKDGPAGSLGASGAISAIQAYFCLRFPHVQFEIGGRGAVQAPQACVIWYIQELSQLGRNTGIGHGAHLGGYTFGALFFLFHDILLATTSRRRQTIRRLTRVLEKWRDE